VLVAAGATGIVLVTRHTGAGTDPVARVTVTATPGAGGVGPKEQPRSAIPWGQVGPGWSAASWSSSTEATSATLFLLSPTGSRYVIVTMPNAGVYDITPDGRRILTAAPEPTSVLEWDVAAGTSRTIALGQTGGATYTRPDGKALLTTETSGGTTRTQRRALDGSVQVTFPADTGVASMTPDGLSLVAGTTTGLAVYGNATGTLVRTLPAPAGYGSCSVVSWWPDGRALTRCALGGDGIANLWLYPVDGGAPTELTAATAGSDTPFGYQAAWPVGTGTLVQEAVGCGVGPLAMLTSPTSSTRLTFSVPGQPGNTHPVPDPVAVVGNVAYLLVSAAECGGAPSRALVVHDVVTGTTGLILGPGVDAGTVGPVAVIDPGR
jgi:TolB protein